MQLSHCEAIEMLDAPPQKSAGPVRHLSASQLAAFLTLADSRSFTVAAQRLGMTQPALSRRIKDLESDFGEPLFARSSKGVELTETGSVLRPLAQRLLTRFADTLQSMRQWRPDHEQDLILAGSTSVMPIVLPVLTRRLEAAFGYAHIRCEAGSSEEVASRVLDGRASLGIYTSYGEDNQLRCIPVLELPLGLLAAPGCAIPPMVGSLDELTGVPLVRYVDEALVSRALRHHETDFPAYFESSVLVTNISAAFDLIRSGAMAIVSSGLGATQVQARELRFIPLPGLLPKLRVDVVARRDRPFEFRLERLIDVVSDSLLRVDWHSSVRRLRKRTDADGSPLPVGGNQDAAANS